MTSKKQKGVMHKELRHFVEIDASTHAMWWSWRTSGMPEFRRWQRYDVLAHRPKDINKFRNESGSVTNVAAIVLTERPCSQ